MPTVMVVPGDNSLGPEIRSPSTKVPFREPKSPNPPSAVKENFPRAGDSIGRRGQVFR